jgi:hypothetical protein
MVAQEDILGVVMRNRGDIQGALRALVKEANRSGGEDNITVVAFDITDVAVHDGQTQENVLPLEDEDTLDETDAVPVVDTMVVSTDAIQKQIAEDEKAARRARRRAVRRAVVAWLALLLFLVAIAALVYWRTTH